MERRSPARTKPKEKRDVGRFVAKNMAINEIRKPVASVHMCAASVITAVEFDKIPPRLIKKIDLS